MKKVICILLIVLNLCFIWGNSMMDGAQSSALSDKVISLLLGRPYHHDKNGPEKENRLNFMVRKAAHGTEYLMLGGLTTLLLRQGKRPVREQTLSAVLFGVLAAMTDETIQLFHDRASMVQDVWIDTGGVICGIALAALLWSFLHRDRKKTGCQ